MFASEKELVNKLVEELQLKYGTKYIVRELRGGNNIADVAYAMNINRENIVFDEYSNAYYYFQQIYSKKRVDLSSINIAGQKANKKFNDFLHELEELGYIQVRNNYVETIKRIDAVTTNFTAIEAKISDWKAGLEQANRYKQFANEVYVALSDEYINKVDKNKFKQMNIGLMSVSQDKMKILIKAKKERVKKLDIHYYIMDRFLKQFYGEMQMAINN